MSSWSVAEGCDETEGVHLATAQSHRDTCGCRDPLGRLCCLSPGNHTWHGLVHFPCPWSHIWALFRNNWLVLSKRGPKSKHWCSEDAQQTRREDDLENWDIAWCRCAERMGLPWAAPGIKVGRGFYQLWQWKGLMCLPLLSHRPNRSAAQAVVQPLLRWESPPPSPCMNKCDPPSEGSVCSSSMRDKH